MFYHAYNGYIDHAFDYDELQPISCSGMDTWGSFQLTTIDALDTLLVLGNYSEFKRISEYIVGHIDFDQDINVSVFETNIRGESFTDGNCDHKQFNPDFCLMVFSGRRTFVCSSVVASQSGAIGTRMALFWTFAPIGRKCCP
jgi:hypothetical protein